MASDKKMPNTPKLEHVSDPQDIFVTADAIMETALDSVKDTAKVQSSPALKNDGDSGSIANKFRGLPMRDLIGGPLIAAAEAQQNLAAAGA